MDEIKSKIHKIILPLDQETLKNILRNMKLRSKFVYENKVDNLNIYRINNKLH